MATNSDVHGFTQEDDKAADTVEADAGVEMSHGPSHGELCNSYLLLVVDIMLYTLLALIVEIAFACI